MVGGLIADSRQRQKVFDRRAESVLKQARELSVLCDVPACVVIYNPDDAIKPWRIWPESEAELRNVIEFYKTKVGSGSTTAASDGGVANGMTTADKWTVDLGGKIESRMDANQSNLVVVQEPPRTDVNNCRLAGKDLWERFDINEFLNFRECDDTLFEKETEAAATSSSSMQQAVGSKRKAPVRVCNFEEPVMMSSQRRRLN
ncbi:unnamed protein product [Rhodiola kirilowii]